jgi:hypothetical protein
MTPPTDDETTESQEPQGVSTPAPPILRVINPDATPEEIAALVAVFSSLGTSAPRRRPRPEWSAPHRLVRSTPQHGPGGWRASSLPR